MNKAKVNDIKRGKIANSIILHDFADQQPDLRRWTKYVTSIFEHYNIVPNRMSNPTGTKNMTFKNGLKKLATMEYQVENIWIGALPPEHHSDMFCSIFTAAISMNALSGTDVQLYLDDNIVSFDKQLLTNIALELANISGAKYGYVVQLPFNVTVGYAWGAISATMSEAEADRINKWGHEYKWGSYKTGDLRDIYPINLLSAAHLARELWPGQSFEQWVHSSPNHGKLIKLSDRLWSWEVADEHLEPVRTALASTGMILCLGKQ